jgi:hypothetical protein
MNVQVKVDIPGLPCREVLVLRRIRLCTGANTIDLCLPGIGARVTNLEDHLLNWEERSAYSPNQHMGSARLMRVKKKVDIINTESK